MKKRGEDTYIQFTADLISKNVDYRLCNLVSIKTLEPL